MREQDSLEHIKNKLFQQRTAITEKDAVQHEEALELIREIDREIEAVESAYRRIYLAPLDVVKIAHHTNGGNNGHTVDDARLGKLGLMLEDYLEDCKRNGLEDAVPVHAKNYLVAHGYKGKAPYHSVYQGFLRMEKEGVLEKKGRKFHIIKGGKK
jgi:hypothetical protein